MSPYLDDNNSFHSPLRIAILECDEPIGKTKEKYGSYGNLFQEMLESGASLLGKTDHSISPSDLQITKFDVVNEEHYPELEEVDAVLLTGSSMFHKIM